MEYCELFIGVVLHGCETSFIVPICAYKLVYSNFLGGNYRAAVILVGGKYKIANGKLYIV